MVNTYVYCCDSISRFDQSGNENNGESDVSQWFKTSFQTIAPEKKMHLIHYSNVSVMILFITTYNRHLFGGVNPGADPGFDRGGPDHDRPKLPTVHSSVMQAKQALFSVGSGACLRAPEALGYFITK